MDERLVLRILLIQWINFGWNVLFNLELVVVMVHKTHDLWRSLISKCIQLDLNGFFIYNYLFIYLHGTNAKDVHLSTEME